MSKPFAFIGSISSGTHLLSDLIPAYRDTLVRLAEEANNQEHLSVVADINGKIQKEDDRDDESDEESYYDSEDATYDLEKLTDLLSEYAPPCMFFGAHPGDGADFGFWFDQESFDEQVEEGTIMVVPGMERVDVLFAEDELADEVNYMAVVNDHGNVTLYSLNRELKTYEEVWAVV